MKVNFDIFQIKKWISQTELKKQMKNRVICLLTFFPSWVMFLKFLKLVQFFEIYANLSNKPQFIKTIYLYPSQRPYPALSENSIYYRGPSNSLQDIKQ